MALAEILRTLDAHSPADEEEARDIQLIKRLIAQHDDILSPSCRGAHITASALVIDPKPRRVLLHFHRKLGRWLQVGGHVDGETDVALAALREAHEETGLPDLAFVPPQAPHLPIDYDAHEIPRHGGQPAHLHLDFRYLLATRQPQALTPAPGESARFHWLTVPEALAMGDALDPALRRLLRKAEAIMPSSS